ncbi:phospholipase A [Halomonadaceae bacterium KBTZ08]
MRLPILVACGLLAAPAAAHPHKEDTPEATTGSSSIPRERMLGDSSIFQPHRRNYLLPITSASTPNQVPRTPAHPPRPHDETLEKEEAKFQLSFRLPLLTGVLDGPNRLWFGYTQLAFWQLYNTDESSPFREINFEPEIFLTHELDWDLGPGSIEMISIGFNHESNGRAEPFSRSWNRLKGGAGLQYRQLDLRTGALVPPEAQGVGRR